MYQKFKNVLYHGTVSEIVRIDVTQGRGNKDFGKGFYMAVTRQQAIGMMHKKYAEAVRRNRNKKSSNFTERLYEIVLDEEYAKTLNMKIFDTADEEWLDFILLCREQGGLPHNYDLVIGPTADDDTMLCLKAYWDGLYGKVGSQAAKRILLDNLEPENLGIQYFIGKQEIADKLIVRMKETDWR
jgi:hypothetical protein